MLDTNTVVSGLVFEGNEADLLSMGKFGLCDLIVCEYVLKEVVDVLRSSKFGLIDDEISFLTRYLLTCAKLYKDAPAKQIMECAHTLKDKEDAPILAAFLFHKCDYLVTGDKELLEKVENAVTTKEALKILSV
jgi:predicted nucleic acid-binding protein